MATSVCILGKVSRQTGRFLSSRVIKSPCWKVCLGGNVDHPFPRQEVHLKSTCSKAYSTTASESIEIPVHHLKHEDLLTHSYCQGRTDVPMIGETLGSRLDKVTEKYPDRDAVVFTDENRRATYADFREEIDRLAAGFVGLGLKRGDRVGMWGPNCMEWVLCLYAAARAGLILVNINPAYQERELAFTLQKVGCSALVMVPSFKTQNYYDVLLKVAPELKHCQPGQLKAENVPALKYVIMSEGEPQKGTFSFEQVLNFGGLAEREKISRLQELLQFDDPINIQFTSGTTGLPKGVTLSHFNIMNNAHFIAFTLDYMRPNTRVCIPVPIFHCFGMVLGCLASLMHGSTAVFPCRGFNAGSAIKAVHQERCTSIYGTPTMFIDMLHHPEFDKYDYSSLRTGIMAGSPCPVEIMKQVIERMNCKEMTIVYGLTELSPATNITPRDTPIDLRVTTIGRPIPHVEIKVVDDEGRVVPVNVAGELCFRGHGNMIGYWDDEEKTKEVIDKSGWLHTGDLGVMDENKYCQVVGRLKDMIIRGGENIYPTEIEQFLYKHPAIEDVQVFGVADERLGEEVCAWIRLKKEQTMTEEELKNFCKGKISYFKIPKHIRFVDQYPLTVSGKVMKYVMKQKMEEELRSNA